MYKFIKLLRSLGISDNLFTFFLSPCFDFFFIEHLVKWIRPRDEVEYRFQKVEYQNQNRIA